MDAAVLFKHVFDLRQSAFSLVNREDKCCSCNDKSMN